MDIVSTILNDASSDQIDPCKSTDVQKEIDLKFDVGLLLASDHNPLDTKQLRSDSETYLKSLTRDNVQLLICNIWNLPTERVDEAIVAKLPQPLFTLPRSRRIPKPKPLTKWEKFAMEKGIKKKKKDRSKLKWDDEIGKWIPTFGKEHAQQMEQKEWLVELNSDGKPIQDSFAASSAAKKERIAKNELQRLRNIARARKIMLPQAPLPIAEASFPSSKRIATAINVARASTASLGKFQSRLPKEKDVVRGPEKEFVPGVKRRRERKASLPSNIEDEKRRDVEVVEKVLKKQRGGIINEEAITVRPKSKNSSKKSKSAKKPKPQASAAAKKGKRSKMSAGRKRR